MSQKPWFVASLLFCSGLSALVYQTTWFREFRLVFGASTYATAAVLAIFMAGLGIGSARLGRVADRKPAPLGWYGVLELGIAASAALSLLLIIVARKIYIATGGAVALGLPIATLVRLLLATAVLAIPTFLMGGTLPAAARAVEVEGDAGRRRLALLYGMNTLGAVTGALLATFVMLERYGNRKTLLLAVALNLVVALISLKAGSIPSRGDGESPAAKPATDPSAAAQLSTRVPILIAAGVAGFTFFLMELVWYRMLTPLLGGTTFTFGLILATALLGIGLGGAAYALWSGTARPTIGAFAVTCSIEALAMIVPFALGDRIAVLANLLRSLTITGFGGSVLSWCVITAVVVLPAALVSGVQFPMLVALLGRGRADVGRDVGAAYAWNTAGAIAGSLAGGFGLLPLLSAPGAWRLAAVLLILLALAAAVWSARDRRFAAAGAALVIGICALVASLATGPTAVWRHTGIGAGRADMPESIADLTNWMNTARRTLVWEADGRESSIAVADWNDRNFAVNGKIDGSARGDDSTQVMSGLLGAILHPSPRRALVVGLGTGSTAGWLAAVPTMERVDVVELEPAVVRVARDFAAVNHNALANPKVRVHLNDAREVLLSTPERYDIVFSEPSNPYRAGIASLYTKEFYEAAAARLRRGGLFVQWVQAYEVDAETIRTIYSTLTSVFPHVNTWRTTPSDLILVSSREPLTHDIDVVRRRMTEIPYARATHNTWRVESAEGFFAHYIGNETLAKTIGDGRRLNTDDRTLIEFGFARTVGADDQFDVNELIHAGRALGADRPSQVRGALDWDIVELSRWTHSGLQLPATGVNDLVRARHSFTQLWDDNEFAAALESWRQLRWGPVNSAEVSRLAEVLAETGSDEAEVFLMLLRDLQPTETAAIEARLRMMQGNYDDAARLVEQALVGLRTDPWPATSVMARAINTAVSLASNDRALAQRMFEATSRPFAAGQWEEERKEKRVSIAWSSELGCGSNTVSALRDLEPHVPWTEEHLRRRRQCYARAGLNDLYAQADADWEEYMRSQPQPLIER